MVALVGHIGGIVLEVAAPGVAHIDIDGVAIAVELPVARHVDGAPRRVVEVSTVEIGRALVGVLDKTEFPLTVERQEVGRPGLVARQGRAARLKGEELSVQWKTVNLIDL